MNVQLEIDTIRPKTPSMADQRRLKILYFAIANVLAVAIGIGIFWAFMVVPEGAPFDRGMHSIWRFLHRHETVAALAASLPFFASLLVGQFEMRKARARRARNEAADKRARIEAERIAQEAARAPSACQEARER